MNRIAERKSTGPVEVLVTLPFPEALVERLRHVSPELRIIIHSARRPEDIPAELWNRVEVLYTDRVLPTPAQAPNLCWVQFHSAGVDFAVGSPLMNTPGVAITTLSGAAAPQIAEFGLAMMLALGHRLPDLAANQAKADWPRDRWERFMPLELRDSTVGIIGYGSIGRELARLARAFGATVLAAKRDVMHPEDNGFNHPGLGDPNGDLFTRLYPFQAVTSLVRECDFVVVAAPLTPETRGVIGAAEFAAMKPSAFLIDFSRGGVVDQAALIQALQERKIAGAALDVFPEEPLPPTNVLWRLPNVIISPHIGGDSAHYDERAVTLFISNLERYLDGLPLYNLFEAERGY